MGLANQVICQLDSVHHMNGARPYNNIMIDESELLCNQVASKTFKPKTYRVRDMWNALTYNLRSTKRVRSYDGVIMGRKSIKVAWGLGVEDVSVVRMPAPRHQPRHASPVHPAVARGGQGQRLRPARCAT